MPASSSPSETQGKLRALPAGAGGLRPFPVPWRRGLRCAAPRPIYFSNSGNGWSPKRVKHAPSTSVILATLGMVGRQNCYSTVACGAAILATLGMVGRQNAEAVGRAQVRTRTASSLARRNTGKTRRRRRQSAAGEEDIDAARQVPNNSRAAPSRPAEASPQHADRGTEPPLAQARPREQDSTTRRAAHQAPRATPVAPNAGVVGPDCLFGKMSRRPTACASLAAE